MTHGHVAGRRRRFAPRRHELGDRGSAGEVRRISFRVAGATVDEAISDAKLLARAEGWILRTVAGARPVADSGLWIVTFAAVRA